MRLGNIILLVALPVLFCTWARAADPPHLWPKHVEFISYLHLARQARIYGKVVVRCSVRTDGTVSEVKVLEGHPLIGAHSAKNASRWTFFIKSSRATAPAHVDLTYEYKLSDLSNVTGSPNTMAVDFPYIVHVQGKAPTL